MRTEAQLYTGGTILTMDPSQPEVEAVGVVGELIVAAGSREAVEAALPRGHRRVDLAGRTMIPGFNEAHNHMIGYGTALGQIDAAFPTVKSIGDIVAAVREKASETPAGQWIIGRGYDDNKLDERRHPCLLYTSPSPRDRTRSRMPSSA